MGIYSGFNPYGLAPPPTFATQVIGAAGIGAVGGWVGGRERAGGGVVGVALGAALGILLTLAYDVLTNYGTAVSIGAAMDPWPVIAGGIAFSALHIVWNGVFFAVGLPALLAVLRRRRTLLL
jgi:hypothetical protein